MSGRRGAVRAAWAATMAVLLAVPVCALGFNSQSLQAVARAAAGPAPQLGREYHPGLTGFGHVRPQEIFLGGDPTGLVRHIHWSGWGRGQAVGSGEAEYDWPGTSVAANGLTSGARVVAFHLGTCRGRRSYNALEWYFPKYGQLFDPHRYIDACTGESVGVPNPVSCPDVTLEDGAGTATTVIVSGLSCEGASHLIAEAPVAQYVPEGGRFMQSGFRCGTEGGHSGSVFSCEKGPLEFAYTVEPRRP
jgi:hypothetical protein